MTGRLTLIGFVFLAAAAYAGGPKWRYEDSKLNDEVSNIYHDIAAVKGNILQVVTSSSTTSFSTASASFQASNLNATITPLRTGSTILVLAFGTLENTSGNNNAYATILRGSTNLAGADGVAVVSNNVAAQFRSSLGIGIYDAPGVNTPTVYTVAVRGSGGTTYFGDGVNNTQIMVLVEVAP